MEWLAYVIISGFIGLAFAAVLWMLIPTEDDPDDF